MTSRPWRIALVSIVALVIFPFTYLAAGAAGVHSGMRTFAALLLSAGAGTLAVAGLSRAHKWNNKSVDVNLFFTHNSADKTVILSHVEAMIAAGDGVKATTALASLVAEHGLDKRLCRLAVDFHLSKLGDSSRAESLLRRMRIEKPEMYEQYATARLIDLYMSGVATYPKAIKELRRLIATCPGSLEAKGAEACIARLEAHGAATAAAPIDPVPIPERRVPAGE